MEAHARDLPGYLSDAISTLERYGATIVADDAAWLEHADRSLRLDLSASLPSSSRVASPRARFREVWRPTGGDVYDLTEYAYELLDRGLDYRRALHMHDSEHFLRAYGVLTHEHCESTIGHAACEHYAGMPVRGAIDGFHRLLDLG